MDNEHRFTTSGTTADPCCWFRTESQVAEEASLILRRWWHRPREIISYAPVGHTYGAICGRGVAGVAGASIEETSVARTSALDLAGEGPLVIVALASTWAILPSLLANISKSRPIFVLHSGSALPPRSGSVIERFDERDIAFLEIFGSTEAGGMAYRWLSASTSASDLWTLFEDVRILNPLDVECRLEIESPRIARRERDSAPAPRLTTDNLVIRHDDRRFEYVGRSSGLIKINGIRYDTEVIREIIVGATGCEMVACVPIHDRIRGEGYEIVFTSSTIDERAISERIAVLAHSLPRPRAVRRVDALPLSDTGKVRLRRLQHESQSA